MGCRGRTERAEKAASWGWEEIATAGDGEIFNSLLIKANFLWLSLPGNPLGGFSGGNGGVDGGTRPPPFPYPTFLRVRI